MLDKPGRPKHVVNVFAVNTGQKNLSEGYPTHTSNRTSAAPQQRLGTLNPSGPRSATPLLKWLASAAAARSLVPLAVAILEISGGHRR